MKKKELEPVAPRDEEEPPLPGGTRE